MKTLNDQLTWWDKLVLGTKLIRKNGREKFFRPIVDNGYGLATGMASNNQTSGQFTLTPWLADLIDKAAGKTDGPLTFRDLHEAPLPESLAMQIPAGEHRRSIDLMAVTTCVTLGRPFELPFSTNMFAFDPVEWRRYFPERIAQYMEEKASEYTDRLKKEGKPASSRDRQGKKPLMVDDMPVIVATRMSLSFPGLFTMIPLWAADYDRGKELRRLWFSDGGITSNLPIHRFDAIYPKWPTLGVSLQYTGESNQPRRASLRKNNSWIYFPRERRALDDIWSYFDQLDSSQSQLEGFALGVFTSAQCWHDNAFLRLPGFRDRIIEIWLNKEEGALNLDMSASTIERLMNRGSDVGKMLLDRYATDSTDTLSWSDHRWARFRSGLPGLIDSLLKFKHAVDVDTGSPKLLEFLEELSLPASYKFCSEEERVAARQVTEELLALAAKIEAMPIYKRHSDGPFQGEPRPRVEYGSRALL